MTLNLIDSHAHLQFPQFDDDRKEVIRRTRAAGVGVINVGTDLATSRGAVALAEQNENMWATVGIHPTDLPPPNEIERTFSELDKLARHEKVVGVGECGFDNAKLKAQNEKQRQAEVFCRQIELAKRVNKPLMIHCRNAYDDLFEILKLEPKSYQLKANLHFFVGDWSTAKKFLDLGFTLSFTGVITFARDYDEVIKNAPLEQIMAETDCPFVAPVPFRGQRNEPIHVTEVIKQIAVLRNLTTESAAETTLANARRLFAL